MAIVPGKPGLAGLPLTLSLSIHSAYHHVLLRQETGVEGKYILLGVIVQDIHWNSSFFQLPANS